MNLAAVWNKAFKSLLLGCEIEYQTSKNMIFGGFFIYWEHFFLRIFF
jgi:hypothetical protein